MHRLASAASIGGALFLALLAAATPGHADVVITIDKSSQRMFVAVNGKRRHSWAVSTGTRGGPPSGVYRPQRLERH
ncbi:MAG: L,D-transpeptidase [Xanthobacteraceae bacterium]